mmetsp:Transcript_10581/g.15914  ORF Transcript_10581/g.15914 Transcript_10581/m.15914 type:complete len:268 (+) Transcript_10581:14-817(+)
MMVVQFWQEWIKNDWLVWGVGPVLVYIMSFLAVSIFLEITLRSGYISNSYLLAYGKERKVAVSKTVPLGKQISQIAWVLFGPTAILNGVIAKYLITYIDDDRAVVKYKSLPDIWSVIIQIIMMEIIGDFFLYWGHRIQHEVPFLWESFHKLHHTLDTPTPLGTIYIDSTDATLQGGLPLILTWLIVRCHPLCFYLYIFLRIGENVVNHSGINHPLLNLICMKYDFLGRASIAHHDSHHKYSNHPKGAKNYAENFYFWDVLFGTYRHT